jgi:hypothetical protein
MAKEAPAQPKQLYVRDKDGFIYCAAHFKDNDGKALMEGTMRASKADVKDFLMAHLGHDEKTAEEIIAKHIEV